jgi:GT2 family glycosyltransferase
VSVTLAAYHSHDTLAACLESLQRQTFRDFEVVVVDSSPGDESARLVRERFPEVRFVHSAERLLPHAARNRGVAESRGRLLVFFDPDVYAQPDCVERLVAAYRECGEPVVGALDCHGERWLDVGIHLCKFSKWLPGGAPRPVDMGPTAQLLVDRAAFDAVGGFRDDHFLADALFSWRLLATGYRLVFEPRAVVAHHHLSSLRGFLSERYRRGTQFAHLRSDWFGHSRRRDLLFAIASLGLLRLPRIATLVFRHCRHAGRTGSFFATLPLWCAGHVASLLGEGRGHLARALRRVRPPSRAESGAPVPEVEAGTAQ